jgi:hypothetical protein
VFVFKRNLVENVVRKELFLLEGEEGFEGASLRVRMTRVIKRSSVELENLFYDVGTKDGLPGNWEGFKKFVIQFCIEESLYTKRKFVDET